MLGRIHVREIECSVLDPLGSTVDAPVTVGGSEVANPEEISVSLDGTGVLESTEVVAKAPVLVGSETPVVAETVATVEDTPVVAETATTVGEEVPIACPTKRGITIDQCERAGCVYKTVPKPGTRRAEYQCVPKV